MKKKIYSVLCVVLTVVIAMSQCAVAFAGEGVTPVVLVHGMGSFAIYENPNTEEEKELEGFDLSVMLGDDGLLKKLLRVAQGENVNPQEIIDELKAFMAPYQKLACDSNGNSKANVGISSYWEDSLANHRSWLECSNANEPAIYRQVCDEVGANNVYAFNYDWRLDACDNAKKLNTFINKVKSNTGKSRVKLAGFSEGTVVVSAYIDAYKEKNDIEKVVLVDGAFNGVSITNVLKKDLYIDDEVLCEYLRQFCRTYNGGEISTAPLALLSVLFSDTIASLSKYLNEIIDDRKMLNSIYTDVLADFGSIPVLWEFIPYESFDQAVSKMSKIGFLDKSSGMYKKIKHYHGVQGRVEANLNYLKSNGTEVAVVANYGTPGIPVTSAYDEQTDILIDTKYASGGATVAKYGETLDKTGKYISEDLIIDASTCMLKDSTWFVKSIQHMNFWYDTEATRFLAYLISTNDRLTVSNVKSKTGYGQFLGTDKEQNIISVTQCGTDYYYLGEEVGAVGTVKDDATEGESTGLDAKNQTKSPLTSSRSELPALAMIFAGAGIILVAFRKRKTA
ncbi:MAG: alpha/beta hydrolase [Eubacterium sp.]